MTHPKNDCAHNEIEYLHRLERSINGVFIIIIITVLFVTGLWAIDIGASAAIINADVVGLFGIRNPSDHYHIGLTVVVICYLMMVAGLIEAKKWGK